MTLLNMLAESGHFQAPFETVRCCCLCSPCSRENSDLGSTTHGANDKTFINHQLEQNHLLPGRIKAGEEEQAAKLSVLPEIIAHLVIFGAATQVDFYTSNVVTGKWLRVIHRLQVACDGTFHRFQHEDISNCFPGCCQLHFKPQRSSHD